jgi:protein disulfide-isomerase A1
MLRAAESNPLTLYLPFTTTRNGAVATLTKENFEYWVGEGSKKDVFVKFYAPWCGACKSMAPEYEKLAKAANVESPMDRSKPGILIAEMDTTTDMLKLWPKEPIRATKPKGLDVYEYPTLLLFAEDDKYNPIRSKGVPFQEAAMYAFLKENAVSLEDPDGEDEDDGYGMDDPGDVEL